MEAAPKLNAKTTVSVILSVIGIVLIVAVLSAHAPSPAGDDSVPTQLQWSEQSSATPTQLPVKTDLDNDGLDDDFEMTCAKKFQPVVYLARGEKFGPSTVPDYLKTCVLRKYNAGTSSSMEQVVKQSPFGGILSGLGGLFGGRRLLSEDTSHSRKLLQSACDWHTAVAARYASNGGFDPDKTITESVTPSNLAPLSAAECGGSNGCYIRCLDCAKAGKCSDLGELMPSAHGVPTGELNDVPFYVHVFPEKGGTLYIQYWFFYNFNGPTMGFGYHQGDWEHVAMRVDSTCSTRLGYQPYAHGTPPAFTNVVKPGVAEEEDGRLVVYSAINSHATYLTPGEHEGGTSFTKDHTTKGMRWFPNALVNAGEKTNSRPGYVPMGAENSWVDYTDVWGSDSAFDGALSGKAASLCESGPHLQWDQGMNKTVY